MNHSEPQPWLRRAFGGKYGYLLTALIGLILLAPTITQGRLWGLAYAMLGSSILVSCIYAANPRRRSLLIGGGIAALDLTVGQLAAIDHLRWLVGVQILLGLIIMAYAASSLLGTLFVGGKVTDDTLKGALCVYLLLGLIWTYLYAGIEAISPGAIDMPAVVRDPSIDYKMLKLEFVRLLYFSYSTLSTLGLGDIHPVSSVAQMCTCLEAMVGQTYLAVLIARLVGMHIAQGPAHQH